MGNIAFEGPVATTVIYMMFWRSQTYVIGKAWHLEVWHDVVEESISKEFQCPSKWLLTPYWMLSGRGILLMMLVMTIWNGCPCLWSMIWCLSRMSSIDMFATYHCGACCRLLEEEHFQMAPWPVINDCHGCRVYECSLHTTVTFGVGLQV